VRKVPDPLLLWGDLSLVVEAKNEARYDSIPKKDAEQLLHSMEWFKNSYPTRKGTPVMVVRTNQTGDGVFMPEGARIITPETLEKLLSAIDAFLVALTAKVHSAWTEKELAGVLTKLALSSAQIVSTFTVPVHR
jgi:hypothetical protein